MRKLLYLIVAIVALGLVLAGCSLLSNVGQVPTNSQTKVKPTGNLAGAEEVTWNLSGDVMPVPPYGSRDITGSDTASKLIVNQPNGNVEVAVTGVMKGLDPYTEYTVILSYGYTPYVFTGWSITGDWVFRAVLGSNYDHDYTIMQNGGTFTGTGGYPASGSYSITEVVTGVINAMGGTITLFHSDYNNGYWYRAGGTINSNGTITGTWGNDGQGYNHPWYSISGTAIKTHTGDTGHPGDFYDYPRFTFLTDEEGAGSWHLNLRDEDFDGSGTYELSVWINVAGGTMLISDTFQVTVN